MSQNKKTPKHLIGLINRHKSQTEFTDEILWAKTLPLENQTSVTQQNGEDWWIGRQVGLNQMIDDALYEYGCYAGFRYIAKSFTEIEGKRMRLPIGLDHPEYKEWRVEYLIRE
jgi:hypothetical protein